MDIMKYAKWVLDNCPELRSMRNQKRLKAFGKSQPIIWKIKAPTYKDVQEDKIKLNSK